MQLQVVTRLAGILAGLVGPAVSAQVGDDRRVALMRAESEDGILKVQQLNIGAHNVQSEVAFSWDSVPSCAQKLFGQYQPTPPSVNGMRAMLPGIDAFYIIHDDANIKRKSRLEKLLQESRLDDLVTWVDFFSEDGLRSIPHQHFGCVFNQSYAQPLFKESISSPLSRNLKHLWVYHEMVRRQLRNVVVMEDNAIFRDSVGEMRSRLRELMKSLPSEHGVVMLGDGDMSQGHPWRAAEIELSFETTHAGQKVGEHLYGPGLGHRGASGYLMTGAGAASILKYVHERSKIDGEADILMENALGPDAFYWYEPPLWVQSESPVIVEMDSHERSESAKLEAVHPDDDNHRWAIHHRYLGTPGH